MRALLLAMTSLVALAAGYPALAQDAKPVSPAVAKAEGDRIIAAAEASDLFENITGDDGVTRLRHKASGMTCAFDPAGPRNNVRIYPQSAMTPNRGDDISCGTNFDGAAFSFYATRYTPMPDVEQVMAGAIGDVRREWTQIKPLNGSFSIATAEGRPSPRFAALEGRAPNGMEAATFILVTHVNGWSFKTRASGVPSNAEATALTAGLLSASGLPKKED
ncbi:MAG: hypothetical protein ACREEY_09230 [Brevundimonas sp.]